ncbi:hypothetical protein ACUTAF_14395 [Pseudomonas sp. SP16.1]|uniref:hypothetical protein n=1 Tax=Pseudomonas sp. SP16.1 TaxID=3458854 RepID=UPI0040461C27
MALFDFLRKKQTPQDRYAGKPFLKLVDSFVLKCIGELDASQEDLLQQMTPKLQKTFSHSGSWEEIVMDQLHFGAEVRSAITELWEKNQGIAKQNGTTLTPMQFVEMFVANNVTNT